jgi:hypothetical protein
MRHIKMITQKDILNAVTDLALNNYELGAIASTDDSQLFKSEIENRMLELAKLIELIEKYCEQEKKGESDLQAAKTIIETQQTIISDAINIIHTANRYAEGELELDFDNYINESYETIAEESRHINVLIYEAGLGNDSQLSENTEEPSK